MSTVATKRGPYARTRQRREEIARAVLDIVEEVGHEAVTIALVAERSDASEPTVLYHFPSRDHLLVAALELADQISAQQAHVDDVESVLSLDQFRETLEIGAGLSRITRLAHVLKGQAATPDHPASAYFAQRNARQIEIFTTLVARRQRDGYAHPALDPRIVALQFTAAFDGLTSLRLTDPSFDLGDVLIDAFRRLAGENVVAAQALVNNPSFGL